MADSKPLLSRDGDPMAAEALLRDVFGIVVDEIIWKGTSASEKVGPFSLLFCPSDLAQNFPQCFSPEFITVSLCLFTPIHVFL